MAATNADALNQFVIAPSPGFLQPESGKGLAGIDFKDPITFGPVNNAGKLGKSGAKALSDIKGVTLGINRYLPSIFDTIAKIQTQQAPALTQSQLNLLNQYGPGYANAEANMADIGAKRFAQTQADITRDITPGVAKANLDIAQAIDPEFYSLRKTLGSAGENLINSINPNGLTEGEIALQERTQNRSNIGQGTANTGSPSAGIKSALGFDNRLAEKRNQLNSVLANVGSFLPGLKSGVFETSNAQSHGSGGQNAGFENFASSTGGSQATTSGLANNVFSQGSNLAANARNIEANKVPKWQQVMSSLPDYS